MDVVEDVLVEGIIEVPAFGDAADGVETVAEKVDGSVGWEVEFFDKLRRGCNSPEFAEVVGAIA